MAAADKQDMLRLFPNGALSLLEASSERVDAEMGKRSAKLKLASLLVRKRIATAVKTRLSRASGVLTESEGFPWPGRRDSLS